MGIISEYFSRKEFACHDGCGFDVVDAELLCILNDVRAHFGAPVFIDSGCRCEKYNTTIENSAKTSQHLLGKAADIRVQHFAPAVVASYLEARYSDKFGIGRYDGWTHIDVRAAKARWDFRKEPVHA